MRAGRMLAGLVGFAGGSAVVVSALVFELQAQGLPMRGSLWELQTRSVLVWVVESLPFLIAFAAMSMASAADATQPASARPAATVVPPPPPPPVAAHTANPIPGPPVAPLTPVPGEARTAALEELVKVLRSTASRATEESRAKSAYLASMSQSFREPLNDIVGHTQALLEHADATHASGLQQIDGAARHVAGIVNNVLDLSKIEVGAMSLVVEDLDLAQVVEEVRAGLGPAIVQSGSQVAMSVGDATRFVRGDRMRVRQIVANLMSHALAESGGESVSLSVDPTTHDGEEGWLAIRVKDAGSGMTEEETERVFDDYQPTVDQDPLRPRSDGGLGLSISRKLADLMGGHLVVESEIGTGSTFSLLLPRADVDVDAVAPRSTVALSERLDGKTLLLVDSDPAAPALATYLAESGLEVDHVVPEGPASEAIGGKEPQIAILGAEVEEVWPAAEALVAQDVRVVVLSLRDEDVEMALQLGVTGFLSRPVERPLLLATLERCLEED